MTYEEQKDIHYNNGDNISDDRFVEIMQKQIVEYTSLIALHKVHHSERTKYITRKNKERNLCIKLLEKRLIQIHSKEKVLKNI